MQINGYLTTLQQSPLTQMATHSSAQQASSRLQAIGEGLASKARYDTYQPAQGVFETASAGASPKLSEQYIEKLGEILGKLEEEMDDVKQQYGAHRLDTDYYQALVDGDIELRGVSIEVAQAHLEQATAKFESFKQQSADRLNSAFQSAVKEIVSLRADFGFSSPDNRDVEGSLLHFLSEHKFSADTLLDGINEAENNLYIRMGAEMAAAETELDAVSYEEAVNHMDQLLSTINQL